MWYSMWGSNPFPLRKLWAFISLMTVGFMVRLYPSLPYLLPCGPSLVRMGVVQPVFMCFFFLLLLVFCLFFSPQKVVPYVAVDSVYS